MEFYQTRLGRKFYEQDVPEGIRQLKRIANALEGKEKATLSVDPEHLVRDVAKEEMNWEAPDGVVQLVSGQLNHAIVSALESEFDKIKDSEEDDLDEGYALFSTPARTPAHGMIRDVAVRELGWAVPDDVVLRVEGLTERSILAVLLKESAKWKKDHREELQCK